MTQPVLQHAHVTMTEHGDTTEMIKNERASLVNLHDHFPPAAAVDVYSNTPMTQLPKQDWEQLVVDPVVTLYVTAIAWGEKSFTASTSSKLKS